MCWGSINDKMPILHRIHRTSRGPPGGVRVKTMRLWERPIPDAPKTPLVLLTGASGYVGGRLIPLLEQQPGKLRCLARQPEKLRSQVKEKTEVVQGDVLDASSLDKAMQGVHTAYYLVHRMSGSKDFE